MKFSFFFLRHNIYCDACVYFFGALCRAFIAFGLRCHTRIFMGHILKIMGWVWDLPYLDWGSKWVPR